MNLNSFLGVPVKTAKPNYQSYVQTKKREGKKPLSEEAWETKVFGPKKEESSKKNPQNKLLEDRIRDSKKSLPKDLASLGEATVKDLPKKYREEIKDYNIDIVGEDAAQAVEIARKIKEGIEKSADICKMSPPVCKGNKGLPRDKMPQIEGGKSVKDMLASKDPLDRKKGEAMVQAGADPEDDRTILQQMIDHLKKNGVRTTETKVPVGELKATQKEILASKTFGMADSHLKGKFDEIGDSVVVSRDGFLLDGHHRWAALLTIAPDRKMGVKVIDMDMDDLLKEAASVPGVYKASFKGEPLSKKEQLKYKKENTSTFPRGKKASVSNLSFPERGILGENPLEFFVDLWKTVEPRSRSLGFSKKKIFKKGVKVFWVFSRNHVTLEFEIDDDGNVKVSFYTYVGGPGFFRRLLAPQISQVYDAMITGEKEIKKQILQSY